MHVSPKSETVELPANDAWLVLAPPELDRVISWHHSINEAMGRLVRLIDQVVVETNPPSQGSRPPRSGSIAATEAGDARGDGADPGAVGVEGREAVLGLFRARRLKRAEAPPR